jgi:HPt (histidine-containing phosphotransfer) domain-containing protein
MDKAEKSKALEELGGIPEAIYNEIGKEFIVIARRQTDELSEAAVRMDFARVMAIAHSLKGSSGNLRLKTLQGLALQIEEASKEKNQEAVLNHLKEFQANLPDAEKAFEVFGI